MIDIGIKDSNIDIVTQKGANWIVSGSGIFGSPDVKKSIDVMKASVDQALLEARCSEGFKK